MKQTIKKKHPLILSLYLQTIHISVTYHTLGYPVIVRRGVGGGLVGPPGVPQDPQLLHPPDAALSQTSKLDPVGGGRLVGVYHEVVPLTWKYENFSNNDSEGYENNVQFLCFCLG